jgi:hypothetical protein
VLYIISKGLNNVVIWYKFALDPSIRAGVMAIQIFHFSMFFCQ